MIFTILATELLRPGQKYMGKIPPSQPKRVQEIFEMMETNAYLRPPLGMGIIFPARPDFPRREHDGGNFEFSPNLFLHITPVYDERYGAGVEITIRKINYHAKPEEFTPEELRVIKEKLLAISYRGKVISPNQQLFICQTLKLSFQIQMVLQLLISHLLLQKKIVISFLLL